MQWHTEAMTQDRAVALIVGAIAAAWLVHLSRGWWSKPVAAWLLRRGHVSLAMRVRFGRRA